MARTATPRMATPLPTRDEHEREGHSSRRVMSRSGAYRDCTKGLPRLGQPVPCSSPLLRCGPGRKAHRCQRVATAISNGRCTAMHTDPHTPPVPVWPRVRFRRHLASLDAPPIPSQRRRPDGTSAQRSPILLPTGSVDARSRHVCARVSPFSPAVHWLAMAFVAAPANHRPRPFPAPEQAGWTVVTMGWCPLGSRPEKLVCTCQFRFCYWPSWLPRVRIAHRQANGGARRRSMPRFTMQSPGD